MNLLVDGDAAAPWTIALAHGAGAPMDSEFMNHFSAGLASQGFRVVRFEFPYMADRRLTGSKKPPNREPVLRECWLSVIEELNSEQLIIGGKSLGGRIASLVADDTGAAGVVCLGYPFHPVGKPDRLRVAHLQDIKTPTLIVQGERDTFGKPDEVSNYRISDRIKIAWLTDGDHSFKPRKASGRTTHQNWDEAIEHVGRFANTLG